MEGLILKKHVLCRSFDNPHIHLHYIPSILPISMPSKNADLPSSPIASFATISSLCR